MLARNTHVDESLIQMRIDWMSEHVNVSTK